MKCLKRKRCSDTGKWFKCRRLLSFFFFRPQGRANTRAVIQSLENQLILSLVQKPNGISSTKRLTSKGEKKSQSVSVVRKLCCDWLSSLGAVLSGIYERLGVVRPRLRQRLRRRRGIRFWFSQEIRGPCVIRTHTYIHTLTRARAFVHEQTQTANHEF